MLAIKEKIGFIGLGLMGVPMARNLLKAGADLTVYNRSVGRMDILAELGAQTVKTPAQLARDVGPGIIIICVSDTQAVESVVVGADGLSTTLAPNALIIDTGTTDVPTTRSLAQHIAKLNAAFVDAPVSGGELGAREGTLSIMAGGQASDIERARPLFEIMGKSLTHIGPAGSGQVAKSANQMIVGVTVAAVAEALYLAEQSGVDPSGIRQALLGGFAQSRILDIHGQRMIDRAFTPGARATTQLKDMKQSADYAERLGIQLPVFNEAKVQWQEMVDQGLGEVDQSGFYSYIDQLNKKER